MKNKVLLALCIVLKSEVSLAYPSLFLTDEEINLIHQNFNSTTDKTTANLKNLRLSSIIYIDASHWSLWVNDRMLRTDAVHDIEGFHLEKVMPEGAKFSWTPPGTSTPITFTLQPNQIFIVKTQKIVAGKGI